MKKILLPLLFFTIIWADKIELSRASLVPTSEQKQVTKLLLKNQALTKSEVSDRLLPHIRTNSRRNTATTLKVLALRVEFVEDNDTLTTGNGKMDLKGFLRPRDGLFYDPPHTKTYFERELQFLHNYYYINSHGKLDIQSTVMPGEELRAYQLPRDMLYYGRPVYTSENFAEMENGLCRLMRDAIKVADPEIDFSQYDAFIIFHAGSMGQSDIKGNSPYDLWAGTLGPSALTTYLGDSTIIADNGKTKISQATILPEMARQDTNWSGEVTTIGMIGLQGTLVHEFGHLLGLPDLYDVTGYSMGVGGFDIMGNGGWLGDPQSGAPLGTIPAMMSAWGKVYLGWLTPKVVIAPEGAIPIYATEMDTTTFKIRDSLNQQTIVKIPISSSEYFLIENREADVRKKDTIIVDVEDGVPVDIEDGEYDFFLPGSGILIWHIDQKTIDDNLATNTVNIPPPFLPHKGVDLEEADGIQDFDGWVEGGTTAETNGSRLDPFFVGSNSLFGPLTNPNSDGYTGKTNFAVEIKSPPDTVMSISVNNNLYSAGFPKNIQRPVPFLSPADGDLDGDGKNELLVSTKDGYVYAWRSDGSSYTGDPEGIAAVLFDSTQSAIAVGDMTGDGRPEIVLGCDDRKIYAFSPDTANHRLVKLPGFPVSTGDKVRASPLLADLNNDGKKEIIIGSTDMKLYALNDSGKPVSGFPVTLNSELRSCPALFDEQDPKIAVLGSDNRLFLLKKDGTMAKNFPVTLSQSSSYALGSPAVGDIDRDGKKEICVVAATEDGYRVFAIDDSGTIKFKSNRTVTGPVHSSPALADLNGDGFLEIVFTAKNRIYAFNYNGTLVNNFPIQSDSLFTTNAIVEIGGLLYIVSFETDFIFESSPIIGDVAGNGLLDITLGSPESGLLGFDRSAQTVPLFPLTTVSSSNGPGLLFDFDQDGKLELACGADSGYFYVWKLPGAATAASMPWPGYLHDPAHTGLYPDNQLPTQPQPASELVKNFYVYPNPCGSQARARYYLSTADEVKLSVLDISGKLIDEKVVAHNPNVDNETSIDLRTVASGIYIIRLAAKKGSAEKVLFFKLAVIK
jgi:M6 family metalloprotease-like protein